MFRDLVDRSAFDLTSSSSPEQPVVALVAVRLVATLLEGALVKLLQAEGAHKVLRVKLLEHGRDAPTGIKSASESF